MINSRNETNKADSLNKPYNKNTNERTEESLAQAASVLKSLSDWNKANSQMGL